MKTLRMSRKYRPHLLSGLCKLYPKSFPAFATKLRGSSFIVLLELLSAEENRNNPSKQIALILEQGYQQYLQENYENADARAEDIRGLSLYAQRYDSTETFLSELALLSTERFTEPAPLVGEEIVSGSEEDELLTLTSVHQAKGLEWKAVFIIWAAEGKFPSPRSFARSTARKKNAASGMSRSRVRKTSSILHTRCS